MEKFNLTCDCVGTDAEDVLCAAAHAMDKSLLEVKKREEDFYTYHILKYGPANLD